MKKISKILVLTLCCALSSAFATPEQERSYLAQLVNQLDAMTPLILSAERQQPKNLRIQFHYTAWRDGKGQQHNGLLEDVQAIKVGIRQKLDHTAAEPRTLNVIRGDYLDKSNASQGAHP